MMQREEELVELAMAGLRKIPGINIMAAVLNIVWELFFFHKDIISTWSSSSSVIVLAYRSGRMRCAGIRAFSPWSQLWPVHRITEMISHGDFRKPGWVRVSLHRLSPMRKCVISGVLKEIVSNHTEWKKDYILIEKRMSSNTAQWLAFHPTGCRSGLNYDRMTIIEVTDKQTIKDFLDVPKILYKDDPNWTCPLDMEIENTFNPARNSCFNHGTHVAGFQRMTVNRLEGCAFYEKTKPITIATYRWHWFFECINDEAAAFQLFNVAKDGWLHRECRLWMVR